MILSPEITVVICTSIVTVGGTVTALAFRPKDKVDHWDGEVCPHHSGFNVQICTLQRDVTEIKTDIKDIYRMTDEIRVKTTQID